LALLQGRRRAGHISRSDAAKVSGAPGSARSGGAIRVQEVPPDEPSLPDPARSRPCRRTGRFPGRCRRCRRRQRPVPRQAGQGPRRRAAACDADALVAGYTADATLFFPDGVVVHGRAALQKLYDGFVKPPDEEGLCGLKATPVKAWDSEGTSFVKFRVTAPFLAKPYFSTDGYVFEGGKIAAEMSTFDATKLVLKK
jgi:hypothetical protein